MIFISGPIVEKRKTAIDFLIERLIRVWPLYAIATLAYLSLNVIARVVRGDELPFDLSPIRLLSFLFIPSFNEQGVLQPILGVGWTLNYEFLFYLAFTTAILIKREQLPGMLAGVILLIFIIGNVLPSGTVANKFLSDPIIFEFLLGALIAKLYLTGHLQRIAPIPLLLIGVISAIYFAGVPNESWLRFLVRGVPAAAIFIAVLLLNNRVKWPSWVVLLGDASYSIYLFHIILIYKLIDQLLPLLLKGTGSGWVALNVSALTATAVAIIAGIVIHFALEKPVISFLRSRRRRKRTATVPV